MADDLVGRLRIARAKSGAKLYREAADRIALLEKALEAADAMAARLREDLPVLGDDELQQLSAYDAARAATRGEG